MGAITNDKIEKQKSKVEKLQAKLAKEADKLKQDIKKEQEKQRKEEEEYLKQLGMVLDKYLTDVFGETYLTARDPGTAERLLYTPDPGERPGRTESSGTARDDAGEVV